MVDGDKDMEEPSFENALLMDFPYVANQESISPEESTDPQVTSFFPRHKLLMIHLTPVRSSQGGLHELSACVVSGRPRDMMSPSIVVKSTRFCFWQGSGRPTGSC